jgi:hypothetical protein
MGYEWMKKNLPELIGDANYDLQLEGHDLSKFGLEEYVPYDRYFYGKEKTPEIKKEFQYAWLHHIHNNPHHWQYWILHNDEPGEGMVILDMPRNYILEMICDWWAFSWKSGELSEIFSWYDKHKAYMKLSDTTRNTVEDILDKIEAKLIELDEEAD